MNTPVRTQCFEIPHLFSSQECHDLILRAEELGFHPTGYRYPADYRNNDRIVLDDASLAEAIYGRIRPWLSPRIDESGRTWNPASCNERFRFCRYRDGQSFNAHRDGAFTRQTGERSWLTCQVYLNSSGEFTGGETRFFQQREEEKPNRVFVPTEGNAIVFDHTLWHDGAPVPAGTKYVMRTDVLFVPTIKIDNHLGHQGYVWSLERLTSTSFVSGGRDGYIRLWSIKPGIGIVPGGKWRGQGSDGQSVTALSSAGDSLFAGMRGGAMFRFDAKSVDLIGNQEEWPEPTQLFSNGPAILTLLALDDRRILAGCADGSVCLIDGSDTTACVKAHQGFVWGMCRVDENIVASVGDDGTVALWVAANLRPIQRVEMLAPMRSACAQDGVLLLGDTTGIIHSLAIGSCSLDSSMVTVHHGAVTCITPIDDGFVSTGEDGGVWLHERNQRPRLLHNHSDFATTARAVGGTIVSGGYDGQLLVSTDSKCAKFIDSGRRIAIQDSSEIQSHSFIRLPAHRCAKSFLSFLRPTFFPPRR